MRGISQSLSMTYVGSLYVEHILNVVQRRSDDEG